MFAGLRPAVLLKEILRTRNQNFLKQKINWDTSDNQMISPSSKNCRIIPQERHEILYHYKLIIIFY